MMRKGRWRLLEVKTDLHKCIIDVGASLIMKEGSAPLMLTSIVNLQIVLCALKTGLQVKFWEPQTDPHPGVDDDLPRTKNSVGVVLGIQRRSEVPAWFRELLTAVLYIISLQQITN
jgi:hypothetical protein